MPYSDRYLAYMGLGPKHIPHREHWDCPDAEGHMTGIDYYEHPKLCRAKMNELYPQLELLVPETDQPIPRPQLNLAEQSTDTDEQGRSRVRWGEGTTWHWNWGEKFKTAEDVLAFSPLANPDFSYLPMLAPVFDYSSEAGLYEQYRAQYPESWGDRAPEGSTASCHFYSTMFMWPLITFGWELFMETCLDPRFERVMDEFAEINRRAFRAIARLPINFVTCHDDISTSRGPICSPDWMHKYIFPRYEEFWGMVKSAGKRVILDTDGCINEYADDVMACGASGFITEPYTDFKTMARKHKDCFLAGEGDNRILYRNDAVEIEAMVKSMVETAKMTGGYMMSIGNHIPWNVPPEAIKCYLDLCHELAHR